MDVAEAHISQMQAEMDAYWRAFLRDALARKKMRWANAPPSRHP
jgi:hypothetical protein